MAPKKRQQQQGGRKAKKSKKEDNASEVAKKSHSRATTSCYGIGKTCFLDFCLHCFLVEGKKVASLLANLNLVKTYDPVSGLVEVAKFCRDLQDCEEQIDSVDIVLYDIDKDARNHGAYNGTT